MVYLVLTCCSFLDTDCIHSCTLCSWGYSNYFTWANLQASSPKPGSGPLDGYNFLIQPDLQQEASSEVTTSPACCIWNVHIHASINIQLFWKYKILRNWKYIIHHYIIIHNIWYIKYIYYFIILTLYNIYIQIYYYQIFFNRFRL